MKNSVNFLCALGVSVLCSSVMSVHAASDGKTAPKVQRQEGKLFPPLAEVATHVGPVSDKMLESGATNHNWLMYGGAYDNMRHSPITTLNPKTAPNLKVAWSSPTPRIGTYGASPVVYGGVMYTTGAYANLMALDAKTGNLLWRYEHATPEDIAICCGPATRGVAIKGDTLFMGTHDAQLLAFDRKSGVKKWDVVVVEDYAAGYSITAAPLIVGDAVITGVAGGEYGIRGFIAAYSIDTGEELWRTYTVPSAGDLAAKTWAGTSYELGGAPTWTTGTYDSETDTLFWGTGNPNPDWNGDARKGDNLYADSMLALDPKTGEMKWYFQFTPHNVWDYDGNGHFYLVDTKVKGKNIKALVQANRNGYFYVIDRTNGEFIRATQFLREVNWAKSMGADGRPEVDPAKMPQFEPTERTCPGGLGGTNGAVASSYSPVTGYAYIPTTESCYKFAKSDSGDLVGGMNLGGFPDVVDIREGKAHGDLVALDVATGKIKWRYEDPEPMMGGVMTTKGGVVITSNHAGHAIAFDAKSGKELWRFNMGGVARSQPIAYELDGKTYIALGIGSAPLIDSLTGGRADLPPAGAIFVFSVDS